MWSTSLALGNASYLNNKIVAIQVEPGIGIQLFIDGILHDTYAYNHSGAWYINVEMHCRGTVEFLTNSGAELGTGAVLGQYVKVDLGSAITAETLTLKSVAEYKEPRINMTGINQCGYEAFASNMSPLPYYVFNSLTTLPQQISELITQAVGRPLTENTLR